MYLSKEGRKNKKKVKIKGILMEKHEKGINRKALGGEGESVVWEKKVGNSGDRRRWQQGNGSGVQMEGVR